MRNVTLSLLGGFQLLVGDRTVSIPSKGIELLALLAINPTKAMQTEKISGTLWPDFPQERALANLATTLWRVKVAVGSSAQGFLLKSKGTLLLNKDVVEIDLWDFDEYTSKIPEGSLDPNVAAKAITLYRGNILETTSDASWLAIPRERTRQSYVRVLQTYADQAVTRGEFSTATRAYELALEADPFNEEIVRAVMRAYLAAGMRTKSLETFITFRRRLLEELKLDPERETRQFFDEIRSISLEEDPMSVGQKYEVVSRRPDKKRIFGRHDELQELDELLIRAEKGEPQWIGVEGEIGVGKTRLVQEFCSSATSRGWKVVSCRWPEFPQPAAYSVLREMLSDFAGVWNEIETLVGQRPTDKPGFFQQGGFIGGSSLDSAARVTCSEVIAAKLRNETAQAPMVIVLEDIHFSDQASLGLILNLQAFLRGQRLLVVLTWRTGECPEPLSSVAKSRQELRRVIRLSRLDKPNVKMICEDYLGASFSTKDLVDFVYQESEGNPLFAIECIRTIGAHSHNQTNGERDGFQWRLSVQVPGGIRAYVVRRMRMLPREGARLVTVAAACGREIEPQFISKVLQITLAQALNHLAKLVKAGFVVQHNERFEFVHDKIRQLCYEQVSVSRWMHLHGRINDVLEAHFPDRLEALAFHSGRAGLSGKAASHWERIGDQALRMWAHSDAGRAYTTALECLERFGVGKVGADQRFQLLRKRALASEQVGDLEKGFADVTSMLDIASQLGDETKSCGALTLESRLLLRQGAFSRALERARVTTHMSQNLGLSALEAELREIAALAMYRLGDHQRAEHELNRLRKVLEDANDSEGLERVWNNLGRVQVVQGRHLQALDSLERAERCGTGNLSHRAMRALFRGIAQGYLGRADEAILDLHLAARDFTRVGNSSGNAVTNAYLASYSLSKGDMVSGILCARKGLPFKAGRTEPRWAWNSASVLSYSFWLVLGNYRRARRVIAKFLEIGTGLGNAGLLLDTAAAIALEEGQFEASLSFARQAVERLASDRSAFADALLTLGRCYLSTGQPDKALDVLSRATAICEETSERLNLPRMWSFLSVAERELGLKDRALAHSKKAVQILSENGEFAYLPQDVYWNHYVLLQADGDSGSLKVLDKGYRLVMRQASQLGKAGRSRFLSVKVNREICDRWEKIIGRGKPVSRPTERAVDTDPIRCVTALIPIAKATRGRRLQASDLIEVTWTADAGMKDRELAALKGEIGLRRARILRLCAEANVQGGDPREGDLSRVLGVTTRTIRSDIAFLRAQGCHVQTRGAHLH